MAGSAGTWGLRAQHSLQVCQGSSFYELVRCHCGYQAHLRGGKLRVCGTNPMPLRWQGRASQCAAPGGANAEAIEVKSRFMLAMNPIEASS